MFSFNVQSYWEIMKTLLFFLQMKLPFSPESFGEQTVEGFNPMKKCLAEVGE